uniref:Uncharacterized protein n=1 Tax=Rhizophora mucronata TaxID=61149 RepID=A0A2P2NLZ0_RHIMU
MLCFAAFSSLHFLLGHKILFSMPKIIDATTEKKLRMKLSVYSKLSELECTAN